MATGISTARNDHDEDDTKGGRGAFAFGAKAAKVNAKGQTFPAKASTKVVRDGKAQTHSFRQK